MSREDNSLGRADPGRTATLTESPPGPSHWRRILRAVVHIGLVIGLAWAIHLAVSSMLPQAGEGESRMRPWMVAAFVLAYGLLMAVPFVPGIEIGIALMMIEGPWIAPIVYLATVTGLCLAYFAGEWLPHARLRGMMCDLNLQRACAFLDRVGPLDREERLEALRLRSPAWARTLVSRYRYLLLAILANTPGNGLIGGGGGIFFVAGLSHLFRPVGVVITVLIAVLPVPLTVWVFKIDPAGWIW